MHTEEIHNNNKILQHSQPVNYEIFQFLQDDFFIQKTVQSMVKYHRNTDLYFSRIETPDDWLKVGNFRREHYQSKKPYMMMELDENGSDRFDQRGFVYATWLDGKIIASIRLCEYPFETNQFVSAEKLQQFLGTNYQNQYLEWTRLLIAAKVPYLLNALLYYAGMQILKNTSYQHYFGYSTPLVKRLFSRFQISDTSLNFAIPHRGDHQYILFKGNFMQDFKNLFKRKFIL